MNVLLVDDDADVRCEMSAMIARCGYAVVEASSGVDALKLLSTGDDIRIVMTDVQMPTMDGMSFLAKATSLYARYRRIGFVIMTAHGTLDLAIEAMRYDAVDFLTKPISYTDCHRALARAQDYVRADRGIPVPRPETPGIVPDATGPAAPRDAQIDPKVVSSIMSARKIREKYFDRSVISDAAWEMFLDILSNKLAGKEVSITSLSMVAGTPVSTALRWINALVTDGYLIRRPDPRDARRSFVDLSPETEALVRKCVADFQEEIGLRREQDRQRSPA